jgi:hypothetical protein
VVLTRRSNFRTAKTLNAAPRPDLLLYRSKQGSHPQADAHKSDLHFLLLEYCEIEVRRFESQDSGSRVSLTAQLEDHGVVQECTQKFESDRVMVIAHENIVHQASSCPHKTTQPYRGWRLTYTCCASVT